MIRKILRTLCEFKRILIDIFEAIFCLRAESYPLPTHAIGPLIMFGEQFRSLKSKKLIPKGATFFRDAGHKNVNKILIDYYSNLVGAEHNPTELSRLTGRRSHLLFKIGKNSIRLPDDPRALDNVLDFESGKKLARELIGSNLNEVERVLSDHTPGLLKASKIVTLLIRDPFYWTSRGQSTTSFDSLRDMHARNFSLALEWLNSLGYSVFRLGSFLDRDLPNAISLSIFPAELRDALELYLHAHSSFCCVTSTGGALIPVMLGRPCLHMNLFPFEGFQGARGLTLPKRVSKEGVGIKYSELVRKSVVVSNPTEITLFQRVGLSKIRFDHVYNREGYEVIDNTDEDILDGVKEMHSLINEGISLSLMDIENMERYRCLLSEDSRMNRRVPLVSPSFFRKYAPLFE